MDTMRENFRRIILLLLDGLGDRSYFELRQHTPLEAAQTPNLDELARLGSNGMFHASEVGQCLPSETAHYLLFGYALESFPGRGLLEAVGAGLHFADEDVLCLAHLCTVAFKGGTPYLVHGRKDIGGDPHEMDELYAALTPYHADGVRFSLEKTGENDGILVMKEGASPYVSDSDPMTPGKPMARVLPVDENPEPAKAMVTANALNEYLSWCYGVLEGHRINGLRRKSGKPEANFLATLRCGRRIPQESFMERWGLKALLMASGDMYEGLARELGMSFCRTEDGPEPGADIKKRLRMALQDTEHDFIHVHTKIPDEAAHRGVPGGKMAAMEALDGGLDELLEAVAERDDLVVGITGDHSTPSLSPLVHSGETVPVIVVGANARRDRVGRFDEVSAAGGCLGLLRGRELMLTLLNNADRSSLAGHRLGKRGVPFFPRDYPPFRLKS